MSGKSREPIVLGDFEQLVLFAAMRLGDEAYGASIQREISTCTGRDVSLNAVYTTLDRLETKGFVRSWTGEPTPQRGGRRKKHYALLPTGRAVLRLTYRTFHAITAGLDRELLKP
jgi:DNA-binding PadR family transcriptional regulator